MNSVCRFLSSANPSRASSLASVSAVTGGDGGLADGNGTTGGGGGTGSAPRAGDGGTNGVPGLSIDIGVGFLVLTPLSKLMIAVAFLSKLSKRSLLASM